MIHRVEREIAGRTLTIETGELAQQAGGSVTIQYGDTVILATATMSARPREGGDFLPLSVDLEERHYAVGRIPGSFFRREGRPSTEAILASRLTDRTIRPLFDKGIRNEIQIVLTVLAADQQNPPDILGMIGASAALTISPIPFAGPISGTRIGYVDGELIINPTFEEMQNGDLDLIVAASRDAIVMVEAGAREVDETLLLQALKLGQETDRIIIEMQDELRQAVGKPKIDIETPKADEALMSAVAEILGDRLTTAVRGLGKEERNEVTDSLLTEAVDALSERFETASINIAFEGAFKSAVRASILHGERPDGRSTTDIRPLSSRVGVLPRVHGSSLFNRGETQVLNVTTLGPLSAAQKIDTINPEETKRILHHYNFPPYSVGEVRRVGNPGRREIGHGALAERAIMPIIPDESEFPYTIRMVSDVLGSNGSSSMASVCSSILSLMDAGVPIKAPVAGIAMGLVTGANGEYAVLTDIQGIEDSLGDMDFKVAGTAKGVTALQMDIKLSGITDEILKEALDQARDARLVILEHMRETIAESRPELNPFAPRIIRMQIPPDRIGALIGPGGKTIRSIVEESKATVDVENDGTVYVGAVDAAAAEKAIGLINRLTKEITVGEVFTGKVVRITDFGAFIELAPGRDGMVHISELANYRVPSVEDVVKLGDEVKVLVTDIDPTGRIRLSRRAVLEGEDGVDSGVDADGRVGGAPPPSPREYQPSGDRNRDRGPRPPGGNGRPPRRDGPGGPPRRRPD